MKESDAEFFSNNLEAIELYAQVLVSSLAGSTIMTMRTDHIVGSAHEIAMAACRRVVRLQQACEAFDEQA